MSARAIPKVRWKSLSKPQQRALDATADKPLTCGSAGWLGKGVHGHATNTIMSLEKLGLVVVEEKAKRRIAHITRAGCQTHSDVGERLS